MAAWQSITFVGYSEGYAQRNRRKWPNLDRPASAALNIQCALPAAAPRLLTLRRVCHSYSAGLPSQRLIKLQFRDRLRIRTHRGRPLRIPGFRCQVCHLSHNHAAALSVDRYRVLQNAKLSCIAGIGSLHFARFVELKGLSNRLPPVVSVANGKHAKAGQNPL